jgi:hypothetical protein
LSWENEATQAARGYVHDRWRSGKRLAADSYVARYEAAKKYVDSKWPQNEPYPPRRSEPALGIVIGVFGALLALIVAIMSGLTIGSMLAYFAAGIGWLLIWRKVNDQMTEKVYIANAPCRDWELAARLRDEKIKFFVDEAIEFEAFMTAQLKDRARKVQAEREREEAQRQPQPIFDCTHQEAEMLAARWMRYLGAPDAVASQATRDGGIDVESSRFIAEVKHHAIPVGPVPVRAVVGVAYAKRKVPVFFSLNGYTKDATEFGQEAGVLLFEYDPEQATLHGATTLSKKAIREGFDSILQKATDY